MSVCPGFAIQVSQRDDVRLCANVSHIHAYFAVYNNDLCCVHATAFGRVHRQSRHASWMAGRVYVQIITNMSTYPLCTVAGWLAIDIDGRRHSSSFAIPRKTMRTFPFCAACATPPYAQMFNVFGRIARMRVEADDRRPTTTCEVLCKCVCCETLWKDSQKCR